MSYYAYDADGYLGDAASIGGWGSFAKWATREGGELEKLASSGHSLRVDELLRQVNSARSSDADAESVRANISSLVAKASEVFIINDGEDFS